MTLFCFEQHLSYSFLPLAGIYYVKFNEFIQFVAGNLDHYALEDTMIIHVTQG